MNTEPPEGDDLQRMLVSMKQNVLERATPRPKRRRFRPGIALGVIGLLAIGTATGAVALSLSQQETPVAAPTWTQQPEPSPSATTPTSAPITQRPTPRPTPVNTAATIPTDCRALVPASDYDRFFGDVPLQRVLPVAEGLPAEATPPPVVDTGSGLPETDLYCLWRDPAADITGLAVTMGHGTPEELANGERSYYEGWSPTCEESDGIRICRQTRPDPQYGTDWSRTRYVRGDTWLEIDQANFPTDNLLGAIVGEIWGD
ncbi:MULTISPECIES: hypothetical protein [unclassified Curtobacterium]|jgi:hypothetical protein|uniref:hypothetical protein n=1 Tax=unclassified Curtobacterium TaxID=257496 RepID=UPI000AD47D9D|nr:hypothetical protein [Curtobacterium sp. MCBA15_016]